MIIVVSSLLNTGGGVGDGTAYPSPVSASSGLGSYSASANSSITITAVSGTGALGTYSASGGAGGVDGTATPSAVSGTGALSGSYSASGSATATFTAVVGTGALGSYSASATGNGTAYPSPVSGTGSVYAFPVVGTGSGAVGWLQPVGPRTEYNLVHTVQFFSARSPILAARASQQFDYSPLDASAVPSAPAKPPAPITIVSRSGKATVNGSCKCDIEFAYPCNFSINVNMKLNVQHASVSIDIPKEEIDKATKLALMGVLTERLESHGII